MNVATCNNHALGPSLFCASRQYAVGWQFFVVEDMAHGDGMRPFKRLRAKTRSGDIHWAYNYTTSPPRTPSFPRPTPSTPSTASPSAATVRATRGRRLQTLNRKAAKYNEKMMRAARKQTKYFELLQAVQVQLRAAYDEEESD